MLLEVRGVGLIVFIMDGQMDVSVVWMEDDVAWSEI